MKLTMTINLGKLYNLVDDNVRLFANTSYHNHMEPYVPRVTGNLYRNVDIKPDGIHFNSPGATFLFMGKLMLGETSKSAWANAGEKKFVTEKPLNYSKEQSPFAQDHWDEPTKLNHGEQIAEEVRNYIVRRFNEQT